MAKQAKVARTYRLTQETVFAIESLAESLKTTQADVIERAVVLFNSPAGTTLVAAAAMITSPELKVEYDE